ncbi:hypothetical protein ACFLQG_01730, partial [Candidatus Zixiibacteriota bacterium]
MSQYAGATGGSVHIGAEDWELCPNSAEWTQTDGFWWNDGAFYVRAYLCDDEFFKCDNQVTYNIANPWVGSARWLHGSTVQSCVQRVKAQAFNHVTDVSVLVADETAWGDPREWNGDPITRIFLLNDNEGTPGPTMMWKKDIAFDDLTVYPGWHEEVIEDVYIEGDFWIGVELMNPDFVDDLNSINVARELDEVGEINGGGWVFYRPFGEYIETHRFGYTENRNYYFRAEFCAIPVPEATCDPLNDLGWATFQGNMARTGASNLALGDAWCDLTLNWNYIHETDLINFAAPVIWGDYLIQTFASEIVILYLNGMNAGEEAFVIDGGYGLGGPSGQQPEFIGSDLRCTPTVISIDHDDDPETVDKDIMFIGGSSQASVGAIDLSDFSVFWQYDIWNGGPSEVMYGPTRYSTFTVLDIVQEGVDDGDPETDDNIYSTAVVYGTDAGYVVARDVYDGHVLWATQLGAGNPFLSGTTDGTNVFFCTYQAAGDGDVFCLLGSDIYVDAEVEEDPPVLVPAGDILWQLSSAGGLVAAIYFAEDIGEPEGFQGGIAYDGQAGEEALYFVSTCNENFSSGQDGDELTDGIFYKVYADDGSHAVDPAYSNRGDANTPIVDELAVFCPTYTTWAGGSQGYALMKFTKATLGVEWTGENPTDTRYRMSGFRTCEPDAVDDLIYLFNEDGFLECWNSVTGDQIYRRRVMHENFAVGFSGAIAKDGAGDVHVVFVDSYGGIYDLMKDDTRAIGRLQFETYNI